MSSKLEPVIRSHYPSQQILCFDRCRSIISMSNIKEGRYKPRLHVSDNLLAGVYLPSCTTLSLSSLSSSCICAHKHTPGHENHEKMKSWVGFLCFPIWVVSLLTALCAIGAPLLSGHTHILVIPIRVFLFFVLNGH